MADLTVSGRPDGRASIPAKYLPYIDWEQTVNHDQASTLADGEPNPEGEHVERIRENVCDKYGSPLVFMTEDHINFETTHRGRKITGYGNFDALRKPDGSPIEQLEALKGAVEKALKASQADEELKKAHAERDAALKQRDELLAQQKSLESAGVISAAAANLDLRMKDEGALHAVVVRDKVNESEAPVTEARKGKSEQRREPRVDLTDPRQKTEERPMFGSQKDESGR